MRNKSLYVWGKILIYFYTFDFKLKVILYWRTAWVACVYLRDTKPLISCCKSWMHKPFREQLPKVKNPWMYYKFIHGLHTLYIIHPWKNRYRWEEGEGATGFKSTWFKIYKRKMVACITEAHMRLTRG